MVKMGGGGVEWGSRPQRIPTDSQRGNVTPQERTVSQLLIFIIGTHSYQNWLAFIQNLAPFFRIIIVIFSGCCLLIYCLMFFSRSWSVCSFFRRIVLYFSAEMGLFFNFSSRFIMRTPGIQLQSLFVTLLLISLCLADGLRANLRSLVRYSFRLSTDVFSQSCWNEKAGRNLDFS